MKQVTATGQTVEGAVQSALQQLEASREQVEITVIDEGKKGLFGLFGSKPAIVKVTFTVNPIDEAKKFLVDVTEKMGIHIEVEIAQRQKEVTFQLSGDKIGLLIGKRGQTLNAIQYLTQLVINRTTDQFFTVVVDAENYRKKRRETLENLAYRLANKSIKLQKSVTLEPMPSFERKIIHTVLQGNKKVKTISDGRDPHRHIVIEPVKK